MSLSSNSNQDSHAAPSLQNSGRRGVRTYLLLVLAMALVTLFVSGLSLLLIRHQLRAEVSENLSQDLTHSVTTFKEIQAERIAALDRENALLANLPTLKALMTSRDDLTIQDGAVEFWNISGTDLFALADSSGRIVADFVRGSPSNPSLRAGLATLLASPHKHYLIQGNSLYACSVRQLYFGSEENGSLLGYVISGTSIERAVRQISIPTGVEASFFSNGQAVASTLDSSTLNRISKQPSLLVGKPGSPTAVESSNTRYLAAAEDLSSASTAPLQLVVLKSFAPAESSINHIDHMILTIGFLALLCGSAWMVILSRILTRPLEQLAQSVRAFGIGNGDYRLPRHGTREVLELSTAFSSMRHEIREANKALLETERLATIGRMASSISHDFRHYLASIYANAEFLLSSGLPEKEKAEIFEEIRGAVLGSTEMVESLLIFSRTGESMTRSAESMSRLLEQAISVARKHPDADHVRITTHYLQPLPNGSSKEATLALVDGKQIERALFNLLLNACQAARAPGVAPAVTVTLDLTAEEAIFDIADNGVGVPESIRQSLFQPFVSVGKQKGTGLGLTLATCIAEEHGGEVKLLSSRHGETIFQMRVSRGISALRTLDSEAESHHRMISHETHSG